MKRLFSVICLAFLLSAVNVACNSASEENEAIAEVYACPMDCEKGKTYTEAGKCPVCEMDLVANTENEEEAEHSHDHGDGESHSH